MGALARKRVSNPKEGDGWAMYYGDYNRYDRGDVFEATSFREVPWNSPPPRVRRTKRIAGFLVCALLSGLLGGAGGFLASRRASGTTTIFEGVRTPAAVSMASVDTREKLTIPQIYATYVGSTVGISVEAVTTNVFGQRVARAAAGSGFVITADGYILTNYHVVDSARKIEVSFLSGSSYEAKLVGGEPENDIAVLKIDASGLVPAIIGQSEKMRVGEEVVAIGNPLGELTYTLTNGVVSALDRNIAMGDGTVMNMLQTNAAINSGNSGGPLFNLYGEVIGITSAKYSSSGISGAAAIEGIGFAIPIDDVTGMVRDMIEHGYVRGKPHMGITVTTVTESDANRYGMVVGAYVSSVEKGSCAERAGLRAGDIIIAIDDTEVAAHADLIAARNTYRAGQDAALTVSRGGETMELTITFDERKPESPGTEEPEPQRSEVPSGRYDFYDMFPFGGLIPW